ncbi:MAG: hypothetical protein WA063_05375 [Minisyncoccia bacterium]
MAKNEKSNKDKGKERAVKKNFEEEQNDDSPVGEARRSFYSGA